MGQRGAGDPEQASSAAAPGALRRKPKPERLEREIPRTLGSGPGIVQTRAGCSTESSCLASLSPTPWTWDKPQTPLSLPSHHHIHPHPSQCSDPTSGTNLSSCSTKLCCSAHKVTEPRGWGVGMPSGVEQTPTAPFPGSCPAHLRAAAPVHTPHHAVATLRSTAQQEAQDTPRCRLSLPHYHKP